MENWAQQIQCEVPEGDWEQLHHEIRKFAQSVEDVLDEDSCFFRAKMEKRDGVIIVKKFYTKTMVDTD